MSWTLELASTACKLWSQGYSTSQITRTLNDMPGDHAFTRNAVIGKLNRLGLMGRGRVTRAISPEKIRRQTRVVANAVTVEKVYAPASAPLPPEPPRAPASLSLPLVALESSQCRFPEGDPKSAGFGFCGCPQTEGSPYCAYHRNIVVAQPEKKPKRPARRARGRFEWEYAA